MIRLSRLVAAASGTTLLALVVASHGGSPAPATANAFQLLTGFAAKEGCSCAFTVGQTDAYCTSFAQQAGFHVTVTFDHTGNVVTASFAGTTRTAHYVAGAGCTLDIP
jgi:hypothetical protein